MWKQKSKKWVLLVQIASLSWFNLNIALAQDETKLNVLSLHVGPNISSFLNSEAPDKYNIDYNSSVEKGSKVAFLFGVEYEFTLIKNLPFYVGLNYEGKGIDLNYQLGTFIPLDEIEVEMFPEKPGRKVQSYYEQYHIVFTNNYLTLPFGVKKYFHAHKWFVGAGGYLGYLLRSKIYRKEGSQTIYEHKFNYSMMEGEMIDRDKKYTSNVDFGISLGTGINFPLNKNLLLLVDYNVNLGLRKLDKMFDNGYKVYDPASGLDSYPENYFGLNSNSKNISMSLTVGLGFKTNR